VQREPLGTGLIHRCLSLVARRVLLGVERRKRRSSNGIFPKHPPAAALIALLSRSILGYHTGALLLQFGCNAKGKPGGDANLLATMLKQRVIYRFRHLP